MADTIGFWFSWLWAAARSMPEFLGNNWVGATFACVCVFFYERKSFYSLPAFKSTSTKKERVVLLGRFLVDHWKATLKLWFLILIAFLIGHTLDLVRVSADRTSTDNGKLRSDLQKVAKDKDDSVLQVRQELGEKVSELQRSCAEMKGANGELTKRSSDQQSTINSCQNQAVSMLAKANPKLTEEIRVVPILFEARDTRTHRPLTFETAPGHTDVEYTSMVLITTNQNEPRFHGMLDCDVPFVPATMPQLSTTGVIDPKPSFSGVQTDKKSWHEYELKVPLLDKEWSPNNPAWVLVRSTNFVLGSCTFTTL